MTLERFRARENISFKNTQEGYCFAVASLAYRVCSTADTSISVLPHCIHLRESCNPACEVFDPIPHEFFFSLWFRSRTTVRTLAWTMSVAITRTYSGRPMFFTRQGLAADVDASIGDKQVLRRSRTFMAVSGRVSCVWGVIL